MNILFEELSYNENDQQFRILCLDHLLEGDNVNFKQIFLKFINI